ncbi:MAG: ABC transporter permease subunit [Pseudomonadota bacterium]
MSTTVRRHGLARHVLKAMTRSLFPTVCLIVLAVVIAAVVLGPWLSSHDYYQMNPDAKLLPPSFSSGHWFGTDDLGRDLFVRTMQGGQLSLLIGVVATLISMIVGVAWGATAGYLGGRVDHVMMRIVDVLYAVPFLFFVILLTVLFERNIVLIFVAIGAVNWLDMARIVRGQTLALAQRDYVTAAQVAGAGNLRIIVRHVVPNLAGIVVVYAALSIPQVILVESFLSFLGLGVQEPLPSWGGLVESGMSVLYVAPWVLLWPATLLAVTLVTLNFVGDALRDALDPQDSRR